MFIQQCCHFQLLYVCYCYRRYDFKSSPALRRFRCQVATSITTSGNTWAPHRSLTKSDLTYSSHMQTSSHLASSPTNSSLNSISPN